jgi:hypothetical protein
MKTKTDSRESQAAAAWPSVGRTGGVVRRRAFLTMLSVVLLACAAVSAGAQVTTARPVHLKVKTPKQKTDSFKGQVVTFTNAAITVRDLKNFASLRTFSFSPELARKMENRLIESGERVTVRYVRNSDTAVDLKGKVRKAGEDMPFVRNPRR